MIDMLSKVDKRLMLDVITSLEEEVENLDYEEEHGNPSSSTKVNGKSDSKKTRPILPLNYVGALISYLILGSIFLYVVVNHIKSTSHLPDDFNVVSN
jgi:hypothetical protein